MIPLIGLDLHDHYIAWLWRPVELPEPTLIPAILVKVVRIVVFPPGIIDPVIVELDTVGLPEIAHYQTPAIEVAKDERTLKQWQFPARLNGA